MRVPLLDLSAHLAPLREEIHRAVLSVVDSTRYIGGPEIEALEQQIAKYVGARHGIGVSSGTDALLVALMALDVGAGDIVVTTPYSFFATAGVIHRLGATPMFVDIEADTYNMDPEALSRFLAEDRERTRRIKAIIPVHLFGQCASMTPILEVAEALGIAVVEDAAQALGARHLQDGHSRVAGSMGQIGCYSFFPSKNLGAMGDGGMVVTSDDALAQKMRVLRNHGGEPKYYHAMIGGNFRLDALQAAILLVKLPHLEAWHKMRQENAAYYDEHLNVPGIRKPVITYDRASHIYNQYVVSIDARRDDLRAFLHQSGIGNEVYYPVPFHLQACFKGLGYTRGAFPRSEYAAEHSLALPIYPELTRAMQDVVIEKLREFHA